MLQTHEARWLYLLGFAGALWWLSRTPRGQVIVEQITEGAVTGAQSAAAAVTRWLARGLRNNNPGNIERTGDVWQGMAPVQSDSRFVTFDDMVYGVRAAAVIFRNYARRYGLRSVRELISRWAPPVENDTEAYVRSVAQRVGVDADTPLDLGNTELMFKFLRAVFRHENGAEADAIPEETVRAGVMLA